MMKKAYISILILSIFPFIECDGFVSEVKCLSDAMVVIFNRSYPDFLRWEANSNSEPILYVHGKSSNPMCSTTLKSDVEQGSYNLSIPYGQMCDVFLTHLEPNYSTAETVVALEDVNSDNEEHPVILNHVYCFYTKSVQTIRYNNVKKGQELVASTGSKPKPKVEMTFTGVDNQTLKAAKVGDTLQLYISLTPDDAYRAMLPKECFFSDKEDMEAPGARRVTFVQSNCPVDMFSSIVKPLANINNRIYVTKFDTFQFRNQTTIFVHCTVQICLDPEECESNCYEKISNSNLTAARLGFRKRRETLNSTSKLIDPIDEVTLVSSLDIVNDNVFKKNQERSVELQQIQHDTIPKPLLICIIILSILCSTTTIISCVLARKLRRSNKLNDISCYTHYGVDGISPTGSIIHNQPIGSFHPNNPDNFYGKNSPKNFINYINKY
uniref:ZP domain-containing protein n=1 Tax=Strongyloides stercoralis TaxID=6248 RepID=A0A0K0EJ53_STRER